MTDDRLSDRLKSIPGVLETGLFVGYDHDMYE
jgi:ribose 5-phosphate isomerase